LWERKYQFTIIQTPATVCPFSLSPVPPLHILYTMSWGSGELEQLPQTKEEKRLQREKFQHSLLHSPPPVILFFAKQEPVAVATSSGQQHHSPQQTNSGCFARRIQGSLKHRRGTTLTISRRTTRGTARGRWVAQRRLLLRDSLPADSLHPAEAFHHHREESGHGEYDSCADVEEDYEDGGEESDEPHPTPNEGRDEGQ